MKLSFKNTTIGLTWSFNNTASNLKPCIKMTTSMSRRVFKTNTNGLERHEFGNKKKLIWSFNVASETLDTSMLPCKLYEVRQ